MEETETPEECTLLPDGDRRVREPRHMLTLNRAILRFYYEAFRLGLRHPRYAGSLLRNLLWQWRKARVRQRYAEHGLDLPAFMIMSITRRCNLRCAGCYARALSEASGTELTSEEWRSIISQADDLGVSSILLAGGEPLTKPEVLDIAGCDLDDWIIIYTSDHGDLMGEHGYYEKLSFYEGSVRVPLIIRWPKGFQGGRVVKENVNLCDLFATLCDLAGIPVPEGLDSRSLKSLLIGEEVEWDNESVSNIDGDCVMIKRDDLKYQYYGRDYPEVLFDLAKDPNETQNLIDRPEYLKDVERFRARRTELGY